MLSKRSGVEIKTGVEVGKDITLDELRAQGYKAFYIAIGCQDGNVPPGIPGSDTAEGMCNLRLILFKEANCKMRHIRRQG